MPRFVFFGPLRNCIPGGEVTLEGNCSLAASLIDIAASNEPLKRLLFEPGSQVMRNTYRVLVNGELVEFLAEGAQPYLEPDDLVQVFPPVSGG